MSRFNPLLPSLTRLVVALSVALALAFLQDRYFQFWWQWPQATAWLNAINAFEAPAITGKTLLLSITQSAFTLAWIGLLLWYVLHHPKPLMEQADWFSSVAAYVVRAAFWAVVFIGITDTLISFLRVENWLTSTLGEWANVLTRPEGRATWVHFPLLALALFVAAVRRTPGFIWLALLVVVAELQIVIARFIFSYEQAFMGDLVRFWYAALFIFASAYTLLHEGHVRVDVFYTNWPPKRKACANLLGCLLLGLPICWIILVLGFGSKTGVIASPILSYEVSQSGYGLYTKYLMAGFLLVFALSMMLEFCAGLLRNTAVFTAQAEPPKAMGSSGH